MNRKINEFRVWLDLMADPNLTPIADCKDLLYEIIAECTKRILVMDGVKDDEDLEADAEI